MNDEASAELHDLGELHGFNFSILCQTFSNSWDAQSGDYDKAGTEAGVIDGHDDPSGVRFSPLWQVFTRILQASHVPTDFVVARTKLSELGI